MFLRPNPILMSLFSREEGHPSREWGHPSREKQHPASSSWESGASQALVPALAMEVKTLAGTSCYPWLFWNLSVLTLCAHSQRHLDKIIRAGGIWSFILLEKGLNQGLLSSAASQSPNSCPCSQRKVGHWDCRHQRGSLMGCARGICSFPLPPKALNP